MAERWVTQTITIPTAAGRRPMGDAPRDGSIDLDAEVYGPFAVHPTVHHDGWTLTHVPTGIALRQGLGSRKAAIRLAESIKDRAPWTDVTYDTRDLIPDAVKARCYAAGGW